MQSTTPPEQLIKNRLDQRLTADDLANVRHALYDYIITNEEEPTDLRPNAELVAALLPHLQGVSSTWNTLRANKSWKTSVVYQHLLEYLHNCFRKKHKYLIANLKRYEDKASTVWDGSQIDAKEATQKKEDVLEPPPRDRRSKMPKIPIQGSLRVPPRSRRR